MKRKNKNKQKQKQKQKQSIIVNIDNSRKSVKRGSGQKQQQQQPTIIPQPIYIPQQYNIPPPFAHTNAPVFNANPPTNNPPVFDSNPPTNNPPVFDANPPSTPQRASIQPLQTPMTMPLPVLPETDSEIEDIRPVVRRKPRARKANVPEPETVPPAELLKSAEKSAGFQSTPALPSQPLRQPEQRTLFESVMQADDEDTTQLAPIFTRPQTRQRTAESEPEPVTDGRCKAITQKGTRCTHKARANGYCGVHG